MNDTQNRGAERERTMLREYYLSDAYFSFEQLWSFSEQIHRIRAMKPQRMIEIGVGNGFVSGFLRNCGVEVLTADINPELKPDLVIPVQDLFKHVDQGAYDLIACCEVLEHIPFDEFEDIIAMFARLSNRLFLTLPCAGRIIGVGGMFMKSWGRRWHSFWMHIPSKRYQMQHMHYWEVGSEKNTRRDALQRVLHKYYHEVDTGCFKLNPYHRYFTCLNSRLYS